MTKQHDIEPIDFKKVRISLGLTQTQLARKIRVKELSISYVERGEKHSYLTRDIDKIIEWYEENKDLKQVYYTPLQVADLLQVKEDNIRKWIRQQKIGAVRLGRSQLWRISDQDLNEFLIPNNKEVSHELHR